MDKRVTYCRWLAYQIYAQIVRNLFFIIISTIIIVIDLRGIGIDENEQERISRHFTDNCVQRRVFCCFFLSVMACQHTSIFYLLLSLCLCCRVLCLCCGFCDSVSSLCLCCRFCNSVLFLPATVISSFYKYWASKDVKNVQTVQKSIRGVSGKHNPESRKYWIP